MALGCHFRLIPGTVAVTRALLLLPLEDHADVIGGAVLKLIEVMLTTPIRRRRADSTPRPARIHRVISPTGH